MHRPRMAKGLRRELVASRGNCGVRVPGDPLCALVFVSMFPNLISGTSDGERIVATVLIAGVETDEAEVERVMEWAERVADLRGKIAHLDSILRSNSDDLPLEFRAYAANRMKIDSEFCIDAFRLGVQTLRDRAFSELREMCGLI